MVLGHLDQFCAHQAIVYFLSSFANKCSPNNNRGGAAIAQWIHLRLPLQVWVPSTPSMLLSFMVFVLYLSREKYENKQKEAGFGPFKKINVHRIKPKGTWIFLWQYSAFGDIAAAVLIRFKNSLHFILRHCSKTIWLKFFNK